VIRAWATEFARRLTAADPVVIDYFLGHNTDLSSIGKLLISWVLLERWQQRSRSGRNPNRAPRDDGKDNWCRFVTSRLTQGCVQSADLHKNNVSFVTFNYDLSLETVLSAALGAHSRFNSSDIDSFLNSGRIVHIYGKLSSISPEELDHLSFSLINNSEFYAGMSPQTVSNNIASSVIALDVAWTSSSKILVIDPDHKDQAAESLAIARSIIDSSRVIYVLGFGFDSNNVDRLNIGNYLKVAAERQMGVQIMYTNKDDSNRVNKAAGRAFSGNSHGLMSTLSQVNPFLLCERSVRNVYDALSLDFDDAESE